MVTMETLPHEVAAVLDKFRVCELSTLAKDGTPITHPLCTQLRPDGRFLLSTAIGLPTKAFNIRRNPKVSLFFSDSTGSGLTDPPLVLVQGDADCPDEIVTDFNDLEDYLVGKIFRRQPDSAAMSSWFMRRFTDWYFMRLMIWVTPTRIRWWPAGDQGQPAREIDLGGNHAS